ncbi:transposase [Streptomyces sp. NPDC015680]|uniref:transposase n=1 Tax=Streptomyces sp. NPDC015680 TaxID=3364962 RepID=UPI0036FF400C
MPHSADGQDRPDKSWAPLTCDCLAHRWLEGRGGQPESYRHRQMADAVRYLVAGGITWRAMPEGFPAWDRWLRLLPALAGQRLGRRVPRPAARPGSARLRAGIRSRRRASSTRSR